MSFLSTEPQSRVTLEGHSNCLLFQFDTHLKIILDRYLAFFCERQRIEATYIESLRHLYCKAKTEDVLLDISAKPTTTRAAWDQIRGSLEKGNVLRTETRKHIEKGLNKSAAKYADHAEGTISRLQQAYLKRYYPRLGGKVLAVSSDAALEEDGMADISNIPTWDAIRDLNMFRTIRAENLKDGYDCLKELVFTPTVKDVIVKYMDAREICHDLAVSTKAAVIGEKALGGRDQSDLRSPGAYLELVFSIPMVDLETNLTRDKVPKVMMMCIKEVKKRGLQAKKIYSVSFSRRVLGFIFTIAEGNPLDADVLQLRHRFENEKSFSFNSEDSIHSIAMLLKLYLGDLPEPLFVFSLQDYRNYSQNRAKYRENDFSLY
ncbi:hypothetical protein EI94DRAFT_1708134 [Lactarius quietus]|nr:hypothetical protein EI94DRAFT_1708134 [Lactarius quietus]